MLCPLLALALLASASAAPTLGVNVSTIRSGDAVKVSWSGVDLSLASPMRVAFSHEQSSWWLEPPDASSLWLGEFSPPIKSAEDVVMGTSPLNRGISTEGTPPFTVPAPVKFISGEQLAPGAHSFIVTNMRDEVNFVLFAGSLTSPKGFEVLAISPTLTLADAAEPMHVRLARTSSEDEMRVAWTSAQADGTHVVQWGVKDAVLDQTSKASTHTYAASDLCGFPANASGFHAPGHFHEAVLSLPAERPAAFTVYYRVGSEQYGWSPVRSFEAPRRADAEPLAGRPALSVIVAADMGEAYEDGSQYHWEEPNSVNTTLHIERMLSSNGGVGIDLVVHPGDLSYATGYESEWDRFMEMIEPIASRVPYMTSMGNHERDFPLSGSTIGAGDSGGECGVPTQARFHMPTCPQPNTAPCVGAPAREHSKLQLPPGHAHKRMSAPVGSADDGWYSFNQGPVHFAVMNTELSSRFGSRQHAFFAADLAAVDRKATPWVLFLGHRQMYCDNQYAAENDMGDLEPLLLKHKVDIAFWGHVHFAQRSCPMYNATCAATKDAAGYDAPIHAVIGNAGQTLTPFSSPKANWSLYEASEWGFSHVTVHNLTHLTLVYYADAPLHQTAPLHHTVTIVRKYPRV